MAITKIKAIKSTLSKAIEYICNPHKTEDGLLVDSFGCVLETASAEMRITTNKGTKNGSRVAYHLIQSFAPDDPLTPDMAFEIGRKFADQVTYGKSEYVIATHVDREHIHNHIIFNSVNFVNHRKYQYNNKEKARIRGINDKLCRENNLSVIETISGRSGKKYSELQQSKAGTSWKAILADLIDKAVSESKSFDDFLGKMELEGVDVKQGKHISFKCELLGQSRVTRGKRIGEGYTKEAIIARIEKDEVFLSEHNLIVSNPNEDKVEQITKDIREVVSDKNSMFQKTKTDKNTFDKDKAKKNINLIVNASQFEKARASHYYANAINRSNLNNLVKSMNFLSAHNIQTADDLVVFEEGIKSTIHLEERNLEDINSQLFKLHEKIKFTQNYKKNKSIYIEYRRGGSKASFYNMHQDEIDSYQIAEVYFKRHEIDPKELKLSEMFEKYRAIKSEKEECLKNIAEKKSLLRETVTVKRNYETTLNIRLSEAETEEVLENKRTSVRNRSNKKKDREI